MPADGGVLQPGPLAHLGYPQQLHLLVDLTLGCLQAHKLFEFVEGLAHALVIRSRFLRGWRRRFQLGVADGGEAGDAGGDLTGGLGSASVAGCELHTRDAGHLNEEHGVRGALLGEACRHQFAQHRRR